MKIAVKECTLDGVEQKIDLDFAITSITFDFTSGFVTAVYSTKLAGSDIVTHTSSVSVDISKLPPQVTGGLEGMARSMIMARFKK